MNPLISVVLTTHCRSRLLQRAIDSLAKQTFRQFEIVLCADEGSFETREVALQMLQPGDTFLCTPTLKGPALTRNLGITVARGKWLCFLDDDDYFDADYFAVASQWLEDPTALHYFNFTRIVEDRESETPVAQETTQTDLSHWVPDSLLLTNFIPSNGYFVPTDIARKYPFDWHLETMEDWDWLIALKEQEKLPFIHHPIFGPVVNVSARQSRNNPETQHLTHTIDYLTIYRKWRASSAGVREGRAKYLGTRGVDLPPDSF